MQSVEGVLVVNPGPLCRKQAGGTFAKLTIHPLPKDNFPEHVLQGATPIKVDGEEDEDEQLMYHGVDERTRVEILRV